jgi:photosystem II stability/assembly factor-like uncharacterized protein
MLVVLATVAVAGCGSSSHHASRRPERTAKPLSTSSPAPAIAIVTRRTLRLPEPVQASSGPGAGEQDAVFLTASTGFLIVSGEIDRTTDGGRRWVSVWRRRGTLLTWIGRDGASVVASGALDSASRSPAAALVRSGNGGRSWTVIRPRLPRPHGPPSIASLGYDWSGLSLRFVTPREAFAVPNAENGQDNFFPYLLLRSGDGGRRWALVRLRGAMASGGIAFPTPQRGFVTTSSTRCPGEIWRTRDDGITWRPVPGTCVRFILDTLSFPTTRIGFAAGGGYAKYETFPQLGVLRSSDGGAHWRSRYERGGNPSGRPVGPTGPFAQIQFTDARYGYALVGGCTEGENGPCPGDLWISNDGGRSWRETHQIGTDLALATPTDAWLVNARPETAGNVLWHSSDRGRSWTPVAPRSAIAVSDLIAAGSLLWAHTNAGDFESHDRGRIWSVARDPALATEEQHGGLPSVVEPSGLIITDPDSSSDAWVSRDGGRTGSFVQPTGFAGQSISSIAFGRPDDGLALAGRLEPVSLATACPSDLVTPVLATTDAGRSWRQVATLAMGGSPLLGATGLSSYAGASVAVGSHCLTSTTIAISHTGGRTWTSRSAPGTLSCGAGIATNTIALLCQSLPTIGGSPTPSSEQALLVSDNLGRTWSSEPFPLAITGVTVSPGRLWLYGETGTVLLSTDGGQQWRAITPAFPITG